MITSSEYLLKFDTSDTIALLAFLISVLSAIYARRAAMQSKRANELALLPQRKAIYDAFHELRMHMTQAGLRPRMEEVSRFNRHSKDAAHYVKPSLANEISNYYDLCFKVADLARIGNALSPNESDEMKLNCKQAQQLSETIDVSLKTLIKKYAAIG